MTRRRLAGPDQNQQPSQTAQKEEVAMATDHQAGRDASQPGDRWPARPTWRRR
jgi:hypothetical protein